MAGVWLNRSGRPGHAHGGVTMIAGLAELPRVVQAWKAG
jgi:hypothetical protein